MIGKNFSPAEKRKIDNWLDNRFARIDMQIGTDALVFSDGLTITGQRYMWPLIVDILMRTLFLAVEKYTDQALPVAPYTPPTIRKMEPDEARKHIQTIMELKA